jgi:hypothetical protein
MRIIDKKFITADTAQTIYCLLPERSFLCPYVFVERTKREGG